MEVLIKDDAHVLVPNKDHKNFTRTGEVILGGTVTSGENKKVKGLYRGQEFVYDLFYTADDKIIFNKHVQPMKTTEINLGADGKQTANVIDLPSVSNLGTKVIISVLAGAGAGLYIAKKRGSTGHAKTAHIIVGAVAGFIAGKYWQSASAVVVKAAK